MREDVEGAMRAILDELASWARLTLQDQFLEETWPDLLARTGPGGALGAALTRWAEADTRPLVLLIDEIDSLIGDTLLAVLRQLRAGYARRPQGFPQSVVLCGVRDVRDYRIHSRSTNEIIAGGSAFNIKAESLRLGDFSAEQVHSLLAQHTEETGQAFTHPLLWRPSGRSRRASRGWSMLSRPRPAFGTSAAETATGPSPETTSSRPGSSSSLAARPTSINLRDKLREDRVRRVVEPLLSGGRRERFLSQRHRVRPRSGADRPRWSPAYRQSDLCRGGAARAHMGDPGTPRAGDGLVRRCRWRPRRRQTARRLPGLLPGALRTLAGALRLRGGRSAASAAGVPAARGQQRRPHRAGVRPRQGPDRPSDRLAAGAARERSPAPP